MKKRIGILIGIAMLYSCNSNNQKADTVTPSNGVDNGRKEATSFTEKLNKDLYNELDFSDKKDFEDAQRGFIATLDDMDIKDATGRSVWSMKDYDFLNKETAPASVNPSLWRVARINKFNGLFKVTDHIYQVRGFDLSNMTIVEGKSGVIVIDPLVSKETASAAINLYFDKIGKKPVVAVIYTHSHLDHYGGVKGIVNEADAKSGKVKIIAPEGFLEAAISENVYAGNAMTRRTLYHTGAILPKGEKGQIDGGLGKTTSTGEPGLIPPNVLISRTGQKLTVDGVDIVFQIAPNTEAPAEMLFYFPQYKALCAAEDCTHTLHNLYTLRGAEVRDSKAWWKTLNSTIELFGNDVEVMFAQHHWPTWENKRVTDMLASQRDMYKYLHDHTLNLINKGYTMIEVGEMVKLPETLNKKFYNRGYYGSVNHNTKAIYQKYMGFYSGNPADLYQLPPEPASKKAVEYMGGPDAVIEKAKKDYEKGEYRWVAQVMNQVVFAYPDNVEAKQLEADALEQLGYQTENGTWRNNFLQGVNELRNGVAKVPFKGSASPETVKAMSLDMIFDYMGIRLNVEKANGKKISINIIEQDTKDKYLLTLENSALIYSKGKQLSNADATITMKNRDSFNQVVAGLSTIDKEISNNKISVSGDKTKVSALFGMLDTFDLMFKIVTP